MRKILITLAVAVMLVTAGCAGSPQEDASPEDGLSASEEDVVYGYQVVEVEGQTFVCFESKYEGFDCEPLNSSSGDGF